MFESAIDLCPRLMRRQGVATFRIGKTLIDVSTDLIDGGMEPSRRDRVGFKSVLDKLFR